MKKILALLLTGALLFSLAACKKQEEIPSDETVVASMKDPIDSLARCMVENQTEYAPDDPEFFWTALYYFAGAYSSGHEGVELLADTYQLKVPTSVMEEYAIALFSDYKGLPDYFPSSSSSMITTMPPILRFSSFLVILMIFGITPSGCSSIKYASSLSQSFSSSQPLKWDKRERIISTLCPQ